jgi:hypothetical protein
VQVRTYRQSEFVRATCVCTSVKRDCTSFAILARVAAMRASNCSTASLLSPPRSACSTRGSEKCLFGTEATFLDDSANLAPQVGGRVSKASWKASFGHKLPRFLGGTKAAPRALRRELLDQVE